MKESAQRNNGHVRPEIGRITSFLIHEARLLDDRKFEDWMALFEPEGYYWAPTRPDQESPLTEVSIFFDDLQLMTQRITRLRHERIHSQIPHARTVHLVANPTIEQLSVDTGVLDVSSNFIVVEYRPSVPEGMQRVFAGRYQHALREAGDTFRIVYKKVTLVNCDSTLGPLAVYF
jgi:3-phenylpropionate/cinnamic acid dioxygenase small subunit